jgi:hypothetical protein
MIQVGFEVQELRKNQSIIFLLDRQSDRNSRCKGVTGTVLTIFSVTVACLEIELLTLVY